MFRNENGFSLIEIIITSIIMVFVVLGSYAFQLNLQQVSLQNTAKYQMQCQGNLALEYMAKYVRQANDPQGPNSNPSLTDAGKANDFVVGIPSLYCNSNNCIQSKSDSYFYHFWSIEDNTSGSNGNLYMQQTKPEGPKQLLVGDYNDGRYGIKVVHLNFINGAGFDVDANRHATVRIYLALGLKDLGTKEIVESMVFSHQVRPLNWSL